MQFDVERKFFKLFGATVRTYTPERELVCRAEQKAFKLKEHIVFYSDEEKTQPMFSIKARKILDLGLIYDIFAPDQVTVLGSLQRKGIASAFYKDTWNILDVNEQQIGTVTEESGLLGVIRRYVELVGLFIPQKFSLKLNEQEVATFQQNRNPFTVRLHCNIEDSAAKQLGDTMVYAIPNMLAIIEQRQG